MRKGHVGWKALWSRGFAALALLLQGCVLPCESDGPLIWITDMSPWGSHDGYVSGGVCGVAPSEARVVAYVYVPNGWWVKPYEATPLTEITIWGTWYVDTTTGGLDHTATAVAVFVVSRDYDPPLLLGDASLPDELYANALAHVVVQQNAPATDDGPHQPPPRPPPPPTVTYRLHGLNFGAFVRPGQDPGAGTVVGQDQLRELITAIAPYTQWIRTFGTGLGLEHAGRLAHSLDLKVAVGAWIGSDLEANEREIDAVIRIAQAGEADMIIVGAEPLLRRDVPPETLITYINRVKREVPGILVSAADAHGELLAYPEVVAACDVICANFYPYWEGVSIDRAVRTLHRQYQALRAAYPGKKIIVAETGWPSSGAAVGEAVPSLENAAFYFLNFVSWARANDVEYFYFEAFDEPWKAREEGPQGAHWGCWTSGKTLKDGFRAVFDGQTMEDNWSQQDLCESDDPLLRFTYVPPIGSEDFLEGQVCHVPTSEHKVAVFIRVGAGWWTKPYWDRPLTVINNDGSWSCDIVTGGNDQEANKIAAFLVPAGYDPPLLRGEQVLLDELYDTAAAYVEVERTDAS